MKPQPTAPTTVSTVCLRMEEIFRERGWVQGSFATRDGVCLVGALYVATGSELFPGWSPSNCPNPELFTATEAALKAQIGGRALAGWNDEAGRTEKEVLATLRATAWTHAGR